MQAVEGHLVQVLRNLIGNARSFSPALGRICLQTRETGAIVEISVSDEGPGIPGAKLEHVFDRVDDAGRILGARFIVRLPHA